MNYDTINDAVTMAGGGASPLGRIDQYELLRELGGGGFGTVYLARNTVSGIDVAVKGLPPLVRDNREELENIRRNFALVSRLHHPNIAAALDLHPVKDVFYASEDIGRKLRVMPGDTMMVMEYAPGTTLSQWKMQFEDGKVPSDKAVEIVRQIASPLDYAHERKIVHRDIKPANIMVETAEDGSLNVRVLDFGLAAEIRTSLGRVSREIRDTSGTRPYMAPEQWLGGRQGPATDQYSLAAMCHELVAGEVPFASVFQTGDPAVMMNVVGRERFKPQRELPKAVRGAFEKALAKDPARRFGSCLDFVAALDGKSRQRVLLFLAVGIVAVAVAAAGAWLVLRQTGRTPEAVPVMPQLKPEPLPKPVPTPVAEPVPKPLPKPETPVVEPVPKPLPKPEPTPVVEPEPKPLPKPVIEPVPQSLPKPVVENEPQPVPQPLPNPVVEPVPQPPPKPVVKPTPDPKPEPTPKSSENRPLSVAELAAIDVSGLKAGAMRSIDIGDGVLLDLVWCPPGDFTMGSPVGEYGRGHNEELSSRTISGGFWLGKYEVTQAQWVKIMGGNPSRFSVGDTASHPVDSVNLAECQNFASELNRLLGTSGFRLPSSVEWEYACRAGTTASYAVDLGKFNSAEMRLKRPNRVGGYPPNPWGLCDMHGNLAEWTPDVVEGRLFQRDGVAVRGGCWKFKSAHCRSAAVYREDPRKKSPYYGFRICFDPKK